MSHTAPDSPIERKPEEGDDDLPIVLFTEDVAQVLRRSRRTTERLIRANKVPGRIDLPGRPSFSRDAFLDGLRARTLACDGGGRSSR